MADIHGIEELVEGQAWPGRRGEQERREGKKYRSYTSKQELSGENDHQEK